MIRQPLRFLLRTALLAAFVALYCLHDAPAGQRLTIPKSVEGLERLMGDGYVYLDRDELIIVSDIDRKTLYQLASRDFILYMHILRRDFFNKSHQPEDDKRKQTILTIFLFKNRESYVQGLRKIGINIAEEDEENQGAVRNGYFYPGRKRNFILINYRDEYERGISTYSHELSDSLLRKEFSEAPIWINEGIATMVGNSHIVNNQLRYKGTFSIKRVKKALEEGKLLSLPRILELTHKDFGRRKNSRKFYDASEQFCRFLHSRNQLRTVYHTLRDGSQNHETVARTIVRVTGRDLDRLEKEWHDWLMKQE